MHGLSFYTNVRLDPAFHCITYTTIDDNSDLVWAQVELASPALTSVRKNLFLLKETCSSLSNYCTNYIWRCLCMIAKADQSIHGTYAKSTHQLWDGDYLKFVTHDSAGISSCSSERKIETGSLREVGQFPSLYLWHCNGLPVLRVVNIASILRARDPWT